MAEAGGVEFVIQGTTLDGRPLRPSDWAERLRGVVVDLWLEQIAPTAYRFLVIRRADQAGRNAACLGYGLVVT